MNHHAARTSVLLAALIVSACATLPGASDTGGSAVSRPLSDVSPSTPTEMRARVHVDLGMAYSTGGGGVGVDLIEAHKWFNLAAVGGMVHAQECRAEISEDMTAREIAEAQRQARAWLQMTARRAA